MIRTIAEWIWRLAILLALCWIGYELHGIHADMIDEGDEAPAEATVPSGSIQGRTEDERTLWPSGRHRRDRRQAPEILPDDEHSDNPSRRRWQMEPA